MVNRKSKQELKNVIGSLKKSGIEIQVGKSSIKKPYSSGVGRVSKGELHIRDKQ